MISKRRLVVVGLTLALAGAGVASAQETAPKPEEGSGSTVDHSKLEALQKEFATGPEVTEACLSCHTEAAKQVKQSIHWTWDYEHPVTGQDLGKNNVVNNYCVGVAANEPRCTSCHVGYGWKDMNQAPPQADAAVDCVVCHDKSDTYFKIIHAEETCCIYGVKPQTGLYAVTPDANRGFPYISLRAVV